MAWRSEKQMAGPTSLWSWCQNDALAGFNELMMMMMTMIMKKTFKAVR